MTHTDEGDEAAGHTNRFQDAATAHGAVQARDVHGGVHFHQSQAPPPVPEVVPRQLRGEVRHFVNRSQELARLQRVVADGREGGIPVTVVTGTAGVGKTSLVLRWAHSVRQYFPGGELYADLRGYAADAPTPPETVLGRFLEDLGVPASRVPVDRERRATMFRSLLADRRMLVVLDNAADSGQIRPLLPGTAGCPVVVTSRDALSGLVIQHGAARVDLATLPTKDAVALLRAATLDHRPGDRGADLTDLARMCARLPLALRIAAERAAVRPATPLGELIDSLRAESRLWNVLTADVEEGPDTMRSVFEWSYRALPEPVAGLFRLLGLHPGNEFGLPAVAGMAGIERAEAAARLQILVRAHLLEQRPDGRYEFHDLLHAYAAERAGQQESETDRAKTLERCFGWYLHAADALQRSVAPFDSHALDSRVPMPDEPLTFDGYDSAFHWFRTESRNLVTATRAAADAGFDEVAWRLAVVLRAVYMHHNAFDDWVTTARIGVDAAARSGERAGEAEAFESLGKAAFQALRLDEAEEHHRVALDIRRALGDRRGTAVSVNALGLIGLRRRRLDEARSRFAESEAIFLELGDRRWSALLRSNLAETLNEIGHSAEAREIIELALADFRELGDHSGEGNALFLLSWAQRQSGNAEAAAPAIAAALSLAAEEDNQVWRGHWLVESARVEQARRNPAEALALSRESAVLQHGLGDTVREGIALDAAGEACQSLGRFEEAARLHERAVALHRGAHARWQLLRALLNLTAAFVSLGDEEQARDTGEEAQRLLALFDDPQAAAPAVRRAPPRDEDDTDRPGRR